KDTLSRRSPVFRHGLWPERKQSRPNGRRGRPKERRREAAKRWRRCRAARDWARIPLRPCRGQTPCGDPCQSSETSQDTAKFCGVTARGSVAILAAYEFVIRAIGAG